MSKSATWDSTTKPILVLTLSSLVVSLLLALVNSFTAPVIEANQKAVTLAAYVQVLPTVSDATELEEITGYTTAGDHRRRHRRRQGARWLHRHPGRGVGL